MRFMLFVKANEESEAGVMPSAELIEAMMKFNEEMAKAGILLALDGLKPSSKGARVTFSGDERTVVDGPFAESKELVAGYWIIDVKSLDEAIAWAKRAPNPMPGQEGVIEVRPVAGPEDIGTENAKLEAGAIGDLEKRMEENRKRETT